MPDEQRVAEVEALIREIHRYLAVLAALRRLGTSPHRSGKPEK
jgi:hypothetical protein